MRGKQAHFAVGECGELIFTKGTVGKVFDLRENGANGTLKMGQSFRFSAILVPFFSTHIPP